MLKTHKVENRFQFSDLKVRTDHRRRFTVLITTFWCWAAEDDAFTMAVLL